MGRNEPDSLPITTNEPGDYLMQTEVYMETQGVRLPGKYYAAVTY